METGLRAATSRQNVEAGLRLVESLGIEIIARLWFIGAVGVRMDPDLAPALRRNPLIDYLEPEGVATLAGFRARDVTVTDRARRSSAALTQAEPWGLILTRFGRAWQVTNGAGSKVLIIDSGYDRGHEDLPNVPDANCGGGFGGCDDAFPLPHGTFVTGIAAATNNSLGVVGGAYGVGDIGLHAWGACDSLGGCFEIPVAEGIQQGVAWDVDVINMSLTSAVLLASWENAVNQAWDADIVMVAAAGNTGSETIRYPAGFSGPVIGVSGVTNTGTFAETHPCPGGGPGSTFGPHVDLAGPFWALSSVPNHGYQDESNDWCGTSFATPHVAAAVALMRAVRPSIANYTVADILFRTAWDRGDPGWDNRYGHGILDAGAAVSALFPLSAYIVGPSEVRPWDACAWQAIVDHGIPPYSFQSSGVLSGTGNYVQGEVPNSGWLYLTVTDGYGAQVSDAMHITANDLAGECQF